MSQLNKSMLYVPLRKALHRSLQAALLFWLFWGFKTNNYDKCVTNKTIDSQQYNMISDVDDLKISHESSWRHNPVVFKWQVRKRSTTNNTQSKSPRLSRHDNWLQKKRKN